MPSASFDGVSKARFDPETRVCVGCFFNFISFETVFFIYNDSGPRSLLLLFEADLFLDEIFVLGLELLSL